MEEHPFGWKEQGAEEDVWEEGKERKETRKRKRMKRKIEEKVLGDDRWGRKTGRRGR